MALYMSLTQHVIVLIRKQHYKFSAQLELAPWCVIGNSYGVIGTLALYVYLTKVFQFQFKFKFPVRVSVSVRVLVLVLVRILVCVLVRFLVKLNMALWMFLSDIEIMLSLPKGSTRWLRNLKGLSYERVWVKSAENLGASPLKTDLSIDTSFSQVHLAGQSL